MSIVKTARTSLEINSALDINSKSHQKARKGEYSVFVKL